LVRLQPVFAGGGRFNFRKDILIEVSIPLKNKCFGAVRMKLGIYLVEGAIQLD
jgi:hypothetical protein